MCGCKVAERVTFLDRYKKVAGREFLIDPACKLKKWPEYF